MAANGVHEKRLRLGIRRPADTQGSPSVRDLSILRLNLDTSSAVPGLVSLPSGMKAGATSSRPMKSYSVERKANGLLIRQNLIAESFRLYAKRRIHTSSQTRHYLAKGEIRAALHLMNKEGPDQRIVRQLSEVKVQPTVKLKLNGTSRQ